MLRLGKAAIISMNFLYTQQQNDFHGEFVSAEKLFTFQLKILWNLLKW